MVSNPTLSAILLKINRLAEILNPLSGLSFVFGMSHMQFCRAQLRAVKVKPTGKSIHTSRLIGTNPVSMSALAIYHASRRAFAFLKIGPDLRRGTGPLRFSLPCLGFLYSLGASEEMFLFPEGSLAAIWLELRSDQANFQIADHFSRKCIDRQKQVLGFQ
jgi:hypothetical protein